VHASHVPILIVLLLIPNTTWQDWRSAKSPRLQQILASGAVAAMNDRTAETDAISYGAGLRTMMSGARMTSNGNTSELDYPVRPDNLVAALVGARVSVEPIDKTTRSIVASATVPRQAGCLQIETLSPDIAADDSRIAFWQQMTTVFGGALVIASTNPSSSEYRAFDQLTPVVVWQPGTRASLLYSASTHQAGLITNTDIAPTLADIVGAKLPGPAYGSILRVQAEQDSPRRVLDIPLEIGRKSAAQSLNQEAVPIIAGAIAICILAAALLIRAGRATIGLALVFASVTAAVSLLASPTVLVFAGLTVAATIAASVFATTRFGAGSVAVGFSILTIVLIVADAVLGRCAISASSLLGYTAAEGARYYGIGNEDMGVLIGATAIVTGGALDRGLVRGIAGVALWLFVAGVLGVPTIGAKAGGLIVALIALVVYMASGLRVGSAPRKTVALAGGAAAVAVGVAALVLMGRLGDSHVSRTIGMAQSYGAGMIWSVAARKAVMDIHLLGHSAWMLVFAASMFGIRLVSREAKAASDRFGQTKRALITGIGATAACLVLNDAGVVAAALCGVFVFAYVAAMAVSPGSDANPPLEPAS
jgi:hypothetical protein